jgi:hypothetical protein
MSNPPPPAAMRRDGRPVVDTFHPDEYLFRRVPTSIWDAPDPLPTVDAIELPDISVGRSLLGHPEWVRFDTVNGKYFNKWGVGGVQIKNIPPAFQPEGCPLFTYRAFHDPLEGDYPHSEIRAFEGEIHLSTEESVPEDLHLEWRATLLGAIKVMIPPRETGRSANIAQFLMCLNRSDCEPGRGEISPRERTLWPWQSAPSPGLIMLETISAGFPTRAATGGCGTSRANRWLRWRDNPIRSVLRLVCIARRALGNATMKCFMLFAAVFAFAATAFAERQKPEGPLTLTLVAKTDKYQFDGGGKTAEDYKKELEEAAKKQEKGERTTPSRPPVADLVLQITNTTKNDVTILVGGDRCAFAFDLTGGTGVVTLKSNLPFTADVKPPKAVTLAAGKSYEIPVMQLSDGARGTSRYVYWTGPGEYLLSATYAFSASPRGRVTELKSEPVKITVTEK